MGAKVAILLVLAAILAASCAHTAAVRGSRAEQIAEECLRRIPDQNQELIDAQRYMAIATPDGWGVVVAKPGDVLILKMDVFGRIQNVDLSAGEPPQTNAVPISKKEARRIAKDWASRNPDTAGIGGILPFQTTDGWIVAMGRHGNFIVIFVNKSGEVTETGWTE